MANPSRISAQENEKQLKKKREEKRREKRIEKRRKEGPTEWELKICDPAQQLPQPDEEACKKGETGQKEEDRRHKTPLFDPKEKEKEGKGMKEWKKKTRREEISKKPPQDRSLNDAY